MHKIQKEKDINKDCCTFFHFKASFISPTPLLLSLKRRLPPPSFPWMEKLPALWSAGPKGRCRRAETKKVMLEQNVFNITL